jgi:hypothetical protein
MSLTSRRRRPLDRSVPHLRDTRLVVIATEGAVTEKDYFEHFRGCSTRVQVRVLATTEGKSAPRHVLGRLRKFRRDSDLGPSDALCVVIDKDRWPDAQLMEVSQGAAKLHALLAVSNPCFELWLYLHFADLPATAVAATSRQLKSELSSMLACNGAAPPCAATYQGRVDEAIARARKLDTRPQDRWPNQVGTRVYRVIEEIRARQ